MKRFEIIKRIPTNLFILHENAAGYSLYRLDEGIGDDTTRVVQEAISGGDFDTFNQVVKLVDYYPFKSSQEAQEEQEAVTIFGRMTDQLKNFLESSLPKFEEDTVPDFDLGVSQPIIGESIFIKAKIPWQHNELVSEINRGISLHFDSFIQNPKPGDSVKAQLGIAGSAVEKDDDNPGTGTELSTKKSKTKKADADCKETEGETISRKKKRPRAHEEESDNETDKKKKKKKGTNFEMEDVVVTKTKKKKSGK